ncbi:copper amine oxidase N-terminal domain-containing protein [uncultured Brevibacillus sp.]|uniref:copper amine oxidase N-terminal domain-containing protein n=1 Tax=uncultured Brevibacillus sp. TaxID=169970 RepID=UPI002595ACCA|nr:copper amine oxidase N-terminal domain-containing protein [uncultured Brevibacillus sp.]
MKDKVTFLHIRNKTGETYRFFVLFYKQDLITLSTSAPFIKLHVFYHTQFLISTIKFRAARIRITSIAESAYKNGQPITMDVPAILYNNQTTMVPIRFVSEALGATVSCGNYSNSVIISK